MESILVSAVVGEGSGPDSFLDSAKLEFEASLQLLAQRAAYVTGGSAAAIALEEKGAFIYHAAAGESQAEPGSVADSTSAPAKKCLQGNVTVRISPDGKPSEFRLLVPIPANQRAMGLIEVSGPHEFRDEDAQSVQRIADLVSVAAECRRAAEECSARISQPGSSFHGEMEATSWHAADSTISELNSSKDSGPEDPAIPARAHSCSSCGFPVSPGRILCVDCEQKSDAPVPSGGIFSLQEDESWLSAHGYTLVSVLIPIIAAAIYFWFRH